MGNIITHINCFSCQKRPVSIFGKKKTKKIHVSKDINTPLFYDYPISVSDLSIINTQQDINNL